jgi:sugar-specific transcriptional regulator TrmB
MTEVITKLVVDCTTGAQMIVPLSPEELAEREAMRIQAEADQTQREADELAKAEAKASAQVKLAALGLTEAEIAALGA